MFKTYSNIKAIEIAEKRVEKLKSKNSLDEFKIAMAEDKLKNEILFEEYAILRPTWEHDTYSYIWFSDKSGTVKINFSNGTQYISYAQIARIELKERYEQREYTTTTTKKKGGVTRAVVGGALFGGVGAIVGAATAGSKSYGNTTTRNVFMDYQLELYNKRKLYKVRYLCQSLPHTQHHCDGGRLFARSGHVRNALRGLSWLCTPLSEKCDTPQKRKEYGTLASPRCIAERNYRSERAKVILSTPVPL
jgi:hypothetical protein